MIEPALAKEPMLRKLAKEPMDPIERADPTEPIESTELRDPMLRIEFVEPMLQRDVVWAMPSSFIARQPLLAQGPVQVARARLGDEDNGSTAHEGARERQEVDLRIGIGDREARSGMHASP